MGEGQSTIRERHTLDAGIVAVQPELGWIGGADFDASLPVGVLVQKYRGGAAVYSYIDMIPATHVLV